jgi:hypothetical protein
MILLAAPCLLPLPGIGNLMGVAMIGLSVMLWRGAADLGLPPRMAAYRLSAANANRLRRLLRFVDGVTGRWARQRWTAWTHDRWLRWNAPAVAVMGAIIFLPIPLGNVLPSLAVMLMGVGASVRDGVALLLGWLVGLAAVAYTALLGAGAWAWLVQPALELVW